ncbi:PssD/Cps14F family polysaccharide biosynthesis glycosyltransferase [uncultured Metabacillus sp.]|uniref:PssD/Cps14F family polysaccharide biosynthesis glycosyltransferase n=1 Tax=Metabacillus sp. Hm71 TaxID=3450743 RepID=UPI00263372E6|nr:PssD/Cps14F family polysaccharide biosynthesis glycosyltransferase [uncultured Metabacillus sp.]
MKILFTSSTGGHLEQLKVLVNELNVGKETERYVLIEKSPFENKFLNVKDVFYFVQQDRKDKYFIFKFIKNIFTAFNVLRKVKPDFLLSTGAGATLPVIVLAKLFGTKVIYIESLAKINNLTITGKISSKFANRFYVQWNELSHKIPNTVYKGRLY